MGRKMTAAGAAKKKHLDEIAAMKQWGRDNGWTEEEIGARRVTNKLKKAYERANRVEEVLPEDPEETGFKPKKKRGRSAQICGFCSTGRHEMCPRSVKNGSNAPNPVWYCACSLNDHK